jgi:hypothetical protein
VQDFPHLTNSVAVQQQKSTVLQNRKHLILMDETQLCKICITNFVALHYIEVVKATHV